MSTRAPRRAEKSKQKRARVVPRAGITPDKIVDVAAHIVDHEGRGALSLARVASELGIKTPSLYAHIQGLDHLEGLLKLRGLRELLQHMQRAAVGLARGDALHALSDAQRTYAHAHPGLFAFTVRLSEQDAPEVHAAARGMLDVVLAVIRGYGLEGDDALHATRALRAATRGFIDLELAGGFGMPLEVDESWRRLLDLLDRGLQASARGREKESA